VNILRLLQIAATLIISGLKIATGFAYPYEIGNVSRSPLPKAIRLLFFSVSVIPTLTTTQKAVI